MTNLNEPRDLRFILRSDGVGVLTFDQHGERVNTLRADFAGELSQLLDDAESQEALVALVICSAKPDNFIAGADIAMLAQVTSAAEAEALSRIGQRAVGRLAKFRVPVVAAIHGACLGGGLEVALACTGRVASLDASTRLGLPEVQLGILPGMGGTYRLPQVVGVEAALDLILTGRQLSAIQAHKMGLVDEVIPRGLLTEVAVQRALQLAQAGHKKGGSWSRLRDVLRADELRELALSDNPLGRKVVFDQARKRLLQKTHGNYPAPEEILRVVRHGLQKGEEEALEREAAAFGKLVVSAEAKALRHLYFSGQSLKKAEFGTAAEEGDKAVRLNRVAVLGAGLMGAGVAYVSSLNAGANVRLKDLREEGLQKGLLSIDRSLSKRVARRKMSETERSHVMSRITCTTAPRFLGRQEVVIEAVFEDLEIKRQVLAEVEEYAGGDVIFASNTSSIPISQIAANARHPECVIGMHYFSPVEKMPLLEIVATESTADWVIRACVDLGRRQGKTVIVVRDGPGFYTTRILGPYLNEAAFALVEGASVEEIDRELVQAGFPVGAITLLDEIGIDVAAHVASTLKEAFGVRHEPPKALAGLVPLGRLGRKTKKGFYDYSAKSASPRPVDETVYTDLGLSLPTAGATSLGGFNVEGSIAERCLLQMVNEAVRCLGEGIIQNPRDGDIGAIFGLGFPPFLGGPFFLVDQLGASAVIRRLERLENLYGERFVPAPRLLEQAERGGRFYLNSEG